MPPILINKKDNIFSSNKYFDIVDWQGQNTIGRISLCKSLLNLHRTPEHLNSELIQSTIFVDYLQKKINLLRNYQKIH